MDENSVDQNRRSSRSPVMLSARIEIGAQAGNVILRNLSADGALLEGHFPPEGSQIVFVRNDLRIQARIVWVEGLYAGVAFDERLNHAELLRHVPRTREKLQKQFRRPGLACRPLTDEDRRVLADWETRRRRHPD